MALSKASKIQAKLAKAVRRAVWINRFELHCQVSQLIDRKSTRLNSSHASNLSLHDALPIYRGALNWQHMLDFYRLRVIEGMEQVTQDAYQRNVLLDDCHARFKVTQGEGYLEMEFDIEDVTKLQNLVSRSEEHTSELQSRE